MLLAIALFFSLHSRSANNIVILSNNSMSMIPIIVAFTPNYVLPVSVTLRSLLNATPIEVCYDVICLVGYEPDEELMRLLGLIDGGSGRLSFRFMNLAHRLEGTYYDAKYTAAANYRLVIAEELPEYDRAIYMDCDIIIRQDISKLYYELDLDGYYMAGVAEASSDWQIQNFAKLGLRHKEYINSGFLVMNLALMRADNLSEQFVSVLQAEYLEFPDQDAINIVCQGRLCYLPPKYNTIRTFLTLGNKGDFLRVYTLEDWYYVRKYGTLHYTGCKPWNGYAIRFEEWWRVYEEMPQVLKDTMPLPRSLRMKGRLFGIPVITWLVDSLQKIKHLCRR